MLSRSISPDPVAHFVDPWPGSGGQRQDLDGAFRPVRILPDPVGLGQVPIRVVDDAESAAP